MFFNCFLFFNCLDFFVLIVWIFQWFFVIFNCLVFLCKPGAQTQCNCRCGRPLDVLGHHRAACSGAGVLASRGSSLEFACQVCREAGGRVSMNVFVRDLDLPVARMDSRRFEVVVDGLPLFGEPN